MELSRVLCSPPSSPEPARPAPCATSVESLLLREQEQAQQQEGKAASTVQASTQTPKFRVVPDSERKRSHGKSAAQKQQRQEHAAFESRVYNLTLDINELRQQIQRLTEFRDLYVMRQLLSEQRFREDALSLARAFVDGVCSNSCGLTPSARGVFFSRDHVSQQDPEASGGVHQFVMQRGPPAFKNREIAVKSIRVLALADSTTVSEAGHEIRLMCGNAGGCAVEVLVGLSGDIYRETIEALFPHILSDEMLVARMIGLRVSFSSRLMLYFNRQRRLTQIVAQADIVATLRALHLGEPNSYEALWAVDEQRSSCTRRRQVTARVH
jgi:hypothetical protein